jgi:hypothetical protein
VIQYYRLAAVIVHFLTLGITYQDFALIVFNRELRELR